tara:strand:- start:34 stop:1173 length:1140 start_codon:yes stop_codon:yes gene_type:complete
MALNQVGLERLNAATTKKIGISKNLIINGAMQVAQRGTSSGSSGYKTIDRFQFQGAGLNASVTTSQADVASGTTPYTLGFRKSYKITNGAQTGPDAGDKIEFITKLEAQDIANSGWNYKSSSSFITLSFWVKSSVAQNFFGYIITLDGTSQNFPFETGSLAADTWTKITKVIPGNTNLQFDNNNSEGLRIVFQPFMGTSNTGSVSLNAWAAFNGSVRTPNQTSTWYTTNGATWEFTGVQLEVGSVATDFEHRSFGEELLLCQRYYQQIVVADGNAGIGILRASSSNNFQQLAGIPQIVPMRAAATGAVVSSNGTLTARRLNGSSSDISATISFMAGSATHARISFRFTGDTPGQFVDTEPYACWEEQRGSIVVEQDAEL